MTLKRSLEKILTIAMVFPGQGSQSVAMQSALAADYPVVTEVYAEASEVLGYDLWQLVQEGPAEKLAQTTTTQPAMLAAGYAAYRAWQQAGGSTPTQMAGHSLGEYTALVASGAVSFSDAMRVVIKRSQLMQNAVPEGEGGMAAILGLDDDAVLQVCAIAQETGVAQAVNFNSPGQVVIAGEKAAIEHAIELAKEAGARRAMLLPVSVPAHSSLMTSAGEGLRASLATAEFNTPAIEVRAATDGAAYGDAANIRDRLAIQVYAPVQWVQTVQAMAGNGASTIIECGPGKVLAGLCRRIDKGLSVAFVDTPESLEKALSL